MNQELATRVRQCPNLPSLPTIAMQVLDLAAKVDVDLAEIARIISKDPALSTKILRTVNSSFYGRSQNVSTISHALVILGLQSVKTLVLGFSLATNLKQGKGFKHLNYWRRSIFAATAARTIAIKMHLVEQEEAFLAALLQDIGMLVLDQVLAQQYAEICESAHTHQQLVTAEKAALSMTHAEVGAILAEQWKLPPILTATIGGSHDPTTVTDPALVKLARLVHLAGWCADVFIDEQPATAIVQVRSYCAQHHNMSEADCDQLLAEIAQKTKEVAPLFEINIGAVADFESILKKANEALVELTLQSQMHANQLQEQNQVLQVQAVTDKLTNLANRAAFDQFLTEQMALAKKNRSPLTLLLLDVDKFKTVNDRFGHQAGDQVLSSMGKLLKSIARKQDLSARYGGEELAVILPGTPRNVGSVIAETIRRAIAAEPVKAGNRAIPVTVSIGVACLAQRNFAGPDELIAAADELLYTAKRNGRNRVERAVQVKAAP